jgi:hypothetical protein
VTAVSEDCHGLAQSTPVGPRFHPSLRLFGSRLLSLQSQTALDFYFFLLHAYIKQIHRGQGALAS